MPVGHSERYCFLFITTLFLVIDRSHNRVMSARLATSGPHGGMLQLRLVRFDETED